MNRISIIVLIIASFTFGFISIDNTFASYPQSNKALVLVNSNYDEYFDFTNYIKPYLTHFGVPVEICDLKTTTLPTLSDYGIIIFGHTKVYASNYPISQLEAAISTGTGLCSFDPNLFEFASGFNSLMTTKTLSVNQFRIPNTTHYITQLHVPDLYHTTNDVIPLRTSWSLTQKSTLVDGTVLVRALNPSNSNDFVTLVEISTYGSGRVIRWNGTGWISPVVLGQMYGMDDIVWRGIVWAARKPFIMLGLPNFATMRVDDVRGWGGNSSTNFEWVNACNNYGWKPWLGTFNGQISTGSIPTLQSLINNGLATASPHSFTANSFIYYNHYGLNPDIVQNCSDAKEFYIQNDLKMSKYFVPHFYEIDSLAIPELIKMNCEFIATHMQPGKQYGQEIWLNCGPYRIADGFNPNNDTRPAYYADYAKFNGHEFFVCLSEIRDDGGYEWYPMYLSGDNVITTVARGIRHLRREFNSMALASLFSHEYFFETIPLTTWNTIMADITSGIASYNPIFATTDYAAQYIRAKRNTNITEVSVNISTIDVSYTANNDMVIKFHLFTESGGVISSSLVDLPQLNGNSTITITY